MAYDGVTTLGDIPLLGQAVAILGYVIVVNVACHCSQGGVAQVVLSASATGGGASQALCPACRRSLSIVGMAVSNTGTPMFNVQLGETPPSATSES